MRITDRLSIRLFYLIITALALLISAGNDRVLVISSAGLAAAQTGGQTKISDDVISEINAKGEAGVIINFQDPIAINAPAENRKIAVNESRTALLGALATTDFKLYRQFDYVPAIAGTVTSKTLETLQANSLVVSVQLDREGAAHLAQSVPLLGTLIVHGSYGLTGNGVNVAVLDSGVDLTHPDLSDSIISQQCFTNGDCPPMDTDQSNSAQDENGHGTNVTGIITSNGTVSSIGFAPRAGIVAVRVLNTNGRGRVSDWVAGLDWVRGNLPQLNVRVINMSVGTFALYSGNCDADETATANATAQLIAQGVVIFASSGNDGSNTMMASPACNSGVIAVGATYDSNLGREPDTNTYQALFPNAICFDGLTNQSVITCFTNSNSELDIVAPGAQITSTGLGGGLSTFIGTSQASPTAAGVAALMLEANPALTPAQIETTLESTGAPLTDPKNGLQFPSISAISALSSVCNYSISATSQAFGPAGGNGSVNVSAAVGCNWTAVSNNNWITITSGSSGRGNGTVNFSVASTTNSSSRTGTLTIAGQTFTVTEGGCSGYTITPATQSFGLAGGAGSVHVGAISTCPWTATSNAAWITVTGGASGVGSGTVSYSVAANTTPSSRTGTITIAGNTFTVNQDSGCVYTLSSSSQSFTAAGGSGSVNVFVLSGCPWTATSSAIWVTITSGSSGSGNGTVNYNVAANTTTSLRTAVITIGGRTHTVIQAAASCNYSISPTGNLIAGSGGNGVVNVSALSSCNWTAVSSVDWVAITSGSSGSGNGTVSYRVATNTGAASRTGLLIIAGQIFTVRQNGSGTCTYSISPAGNLIVSAGGSGSVNVTAGAGCGWVATSNANWISITSGNSGTGNGTVDYLVAANNLGVPRTGTINIAGQIFTINQTDSSGCGTGFMSIGQSLTGSLSATDCRSPIRGNRFYADRYLFSARAGQDVMILLKSTAFDTFLYLLSPTGAILASDNNGAGGSNSKIPTTGSYYRLPSDGVYTIEVTSFPANVTGLYDLSLNVPGELILNGGFETVANPWVLAGDATYLRDDPFPHGGTGLIRLGGVDNSTAIAYQQFTVPGTATSANLSFWLSVTSDETTTTATNDLLYVEILNTSGALLSTVATYSNLQKGPMGAYQLKGSFNLLAYRGQTIQLRFRTITNSTNITTFYIDDVSVR